MTNSTQSEAPKVLLEENDESRRQFVTFHVGSECMAFDMERVMEIVRVPQTVNVPLTPGSLLGLANLRGAILPVLSLRRILCLEDADNTDATRVMVINYGGQPMGFVVDRVTRVISVNPDTIEAMDRVRATVDAGLLSGVLKNVDDQGLVQLVDVDALTEREYGQMSASNEALFGGLAGATSSLGQVQADNEDDEQNILQLVSFSVADQEYSFSIEATQEIIRLPAKINSVPKAPSHVIGMIDLRNRVLPLVKLRTMFHLPETELSEVNRIIVLTLKNGGQVSMVGVVVDEVREVLRIHQDKIESVPPLLLNSAEQHELEGVCQLEQGKRIVTLLSAEKLFQRSEIIDAVESVDQYTDAEVSQNQGESHEQGNVTDMYAEQVSEHDEDEEPQLVVFNLEEQEYGVMIESVREILRLPDNLTKVPKTSDFVEGMINLRGNVLPIIDMRRRFGLNSQDANDRQRILVLNNGQSLTGFIVDSVSEVLRLQTEQIESAPNLSQEQSKVLGRIVNLRDNKRIITVLEPDHLLTNEEHAALVERSNESPGS